MHMNNPPTPSENPEEEMSARQTLLKNPLKVATDFGELEVIHVYSRAQALEDGVLVALSEGETKALCLEHYREPLACTADVWALLERAIVNPRYCNDLQGLLHDILFMSKRGRQVAPDTRLFPVIIKGVGKRLLHELKLVIGPGDAGEPVLTLMFPWED